MVDGQNRGALGASQRGRVVEQNMWVSAGKSTAIRSRWRVEVILELACFSEIGVDFEGLATGCSWFLVLRASLCAFAREVRSRMPDSYHLRWAQD